MSYSIGLQAAWVADELVDVHTALEVFALSRGASFRCRLLGIDSDRSQRPVYYDAISDRPQLQLQLQRPMTGHSDPCQIIVTRLFELNAEIMLAQRWSRVLGGALTLS